MAKPAADDTAAGPNWSRARVVVAGAAGDLGGRIVAALAGRGADVAALLRPDAASAEATRMAALGTEPVHARACDRTALSAAYSGASVMVCA